MAAAVARPGGELARRRLVGGLSGALLAFGAAACGPAPGASSGADGSPAQEPVRLRFLMRAGNIEESNAQMMPRWDARNPHIGVEWAYAANVAQTVVTHAASGDLEDLLDGSMGGQVPQVWLTTGVVIPLDGHVRSQRVNPRDWYKAVWDAHFVDGRQFSLPWQGQVFGLALYYNKNVFDEVGVKHPDLTWTLDDLVAAADRLKVVQGTEVRRWGMGSGEEGGTTTLTGERLPSHMRNFNAELLSPDLKRFAWGDGPEALRALTWYTDMMQKRPGMLYSRGGYKEAPGGDPSIEPGAQYAPRLLEGRVAMGIRGWMGGTGRFAGYIRDNPKARYGMTFSPRGPTGRRGGWVTSAASSISKASRHPDQAFRFLVDFTGHEWSLSRGLQQTGSTTLNGRPDVYRDPQLVQEPFLPKDVAETKAKAMDFTEKDEDCSFVRGVMPNFLNTELWEAEVQTIGKIVTGEAPASQAMMAELRQLVEVIMQKPRPLTAR
jgi:ABC-type glycerol-3-phosphate transport system substrate-binding protein